MHALLAAAMDHLGIEHDNGLTDSDEAEKIESMSRGDLKKLIGALETVPEVEGDDVRIYLRFMGADA